MQNTHAQKIDPAVLCRRIAAAVQGIEDDSLEILISKCAVSLPLVCFSLPDKLVDGLASCPFQCVEM